MQHKRLIILTGDGKGKTTSALGMILRAAGHGLRTCLIHFIKADDSTGEARALQHLSVVEQHTCGLGFVTTGSKTYPQHRQAAEDAFNLACEKLQNPAYQMVVLDEICGAISLGLLDEHKICAALKTASPGKIIILTGRDAGKALIDLADTVSHIDNIKHAYANGCTAQAGVEF